ncbi:hypothetical protein Poli38472_010481 [Pythium oligandrum]|uniref:Guanine nucleotide-binding protein subunit beta-like protein n=1 Tax=Pythium oligandrum TaxID=41045 RepID=A0A8K1C337_PYTOL|nr:hypothetical protein Poli38472_010481 [Pythium oligandrum]|eukprot:TMW55599.1 hypothetical protein Poli38472_010481 [Pythium oligandrum]
MTSRSVRYEEYASHGYDVSEDSVEDALTRVKITPSAKASGSTGRARTKPMGAAKHSAAASHRQNDTYMEAFDAAYDEMAERHGVSGKADVRERSAPSKTAKEHIVRELETPSATTGEDYDGAWLSGPASPEGRVQNVSAQPIMCMSMSPDRREVVVGSSDHALYTIPLGSSSAPGARGGRAAQGLGRSRTLYTKKFGHTEWVTCATYLPDNRILSGGMDSKLCLWDATGVKCEDLVGHSGSVTLVKTLSEEIAISASYDKTVRAWNVGRKASSRQRELASIKVGSAPILDMSVLATAAPSVITGDRDGCAHVVDVNDNKVSRKFTAAHRGHTTSVLASQYDESAVCFSGGQDGAVKVWDLRQKGSTPAHALELHIDRKSGKAGAVGFIKEPDANTLITGGADGTIKVLDKRASFKTLFTFAEHMDFIYSLHVEHQLCFSGAGNGMLHVHDWKRGKLLYGLGANQAAVRAIETTPTQLIAAGDDGGVIVYDM